MKKIFYILFAATLFVSFAACTSKKGEENKETPADPVEETTVAPADTLANDAVKYAEPTPEEALKAFTAYAKEYVDAYNNIIKDPDKFKKLGGQLQQKMADMERLKIDFTEDQLKDYAKTLEIISQINSVKKQ